MCTLTIFFYEKTNSLVAGFNRDELKIRKIALPPSFHHDSEKGTVMLYPSDTHSFGTWIGVNDAGYSFFLLNYNQKNLYKNYTTNPAYKDKKSRGGIIPSLLQFTSHEDILDAIKKLKYYEYSPFRLVFLNPYLKQVFFMIYTGRGVKFRKHDLPFFMASSGIGDMHMYPVRKRLYKKFFEKEMSVKRQLQFHNYYDPVKPSRGILMSRKLAHTVSQSFLLYRDRKIIFHYFDVLQKKKYRYSMEIKKEPEAPF